MTTPMAINHQDQHTLTIEQEIRVHAPIETTFAALLDQLGPNFNTPDGDPLHSKVEAFPGGRWYRDLGHNNGHFWATVQAIKRPALLEFSGPLMMSLAVTNNVQYRLKEDNGITVITFHHYGFGGFPAGRAEEMGRGWRMILDRTKTQAEGSAPRA